MCCEDDPNICMVVILDYNTEINGHRISIRSLFQNLGLGEPEELERITIPKMNAVEFEFDEDEDEDEDEDDGFVY